MGMYNYTMICLTLLLLCGCGGGGGGNGDGKSDDDTVQIRDIPVRDVEAAPDTNPALLAEVDPDFLLGVCLNPATFGDYNVTAVERTIVLAIDIWMHGITIDPRTDMVPPDQIDFLTLALHEFGHAIGIEVHLPIGKGIMQEKISYGEQGRQRALSLGDIALLHEAEVLFGLSYIGRRPGCDIEIGFVEFAEPEILAAAFNQQLIAFDVREYYFVHNDTQPTTRVATAVASDYSQWGR